ncbi:MAG: MFS transporter [Rhizobiaceae bacterium]|nr:MFS transporter [Rhizobiaceae bacterium]
MTGRRVATIAMLLIAGIFAGAQLGKIAPLVAWYQAEAGFSLVLVGWLTSMIGAFVAVVALPAGWAIDRVGIRRAALVGSLFLSAGAIALPLLDAPALILSARLIEGIGYVVLVIALPALLTAISPPAWRGPVLAVWSCFVPVGYAVSDIVARALLPVVDPAAYLLLMAAGYVLFAGGGLLLAALTPDEGDIPGSAETGTGARVSTLNPSVLLIALSFGCFVVQSVSFFSFAPAFIAEGGALILSAGVITLFTPIGNVLAGFLVAGAGARRIAWIAVAAFALTAAATVLIYASPVPVVATVAAVIFCITSGIVGSALFAAIPLVVPRGGSVSIAIGVVAQAGGIGTLFGPPLAAWVIGLGGWTGLGAYLAVVGVVGIVFLLPDALRAVPSRGNA